jgi:cytoskeletal protein RodZ
MGTSSPQDGTATCGVCGSSNRAGARFCISCGSAIETAPSHPIGSAAGPYSALHDPQGGTADAPASGSIASTVPDASPPAPTSMPGRYCPSGHQVGSSAQFCGYCGASVTDKAGTAAIATETRSTPGTGATARVPVVPVPSAPPIQPVIQPLGPAPRSQATLWFVAGIAVVVVLALAGGLTYYLTSRHQAQSAPSTAAANQSTRTKPTTNANSSTKVTGTLPSNSNGGSTTNSSDTADSIQSEATALNSLISSSAAARTGVQPAYNDIDSCTNDGSNLQSDYTTLEQAATTRQGLLTQLQNLDVSQLPQSGALVEYLIGAWSESISADQSFAGWAQDEMNGGCTQQDHGDSNWVSGNNASVQADTAKNSFTQIWNSTIATTYSLTQWQPDQI